MTRKQLAQLLRSDHQRRLDCMTSDELIAEANICCDCGSQILDSAQLALAISQAEDLEEFVGICDEMRDAQGWN